MRGAGRTDFQQGSAHRLFRSIREQLFTLRERVPEVPTDKPLVIVCQTGKRSGLATLIMKKAGFARVANAAGGMVRWRELGLPL